MRINLKLIVIFLEITMIPLIILGYIGYSTARSAITSQIITKLEAVADIQKSRLENANKANLEKLSLLTHDPDLLQAVVNYNKAPNIELRGKVQNILSDKIKEIPSFKELSIVNLAGDIISSTNPQSIGLNLSEYTYFQEGKNTYSVNHFTRDQNGTITLQITGPLIVDNKTAGVLVMNSDGSNITTIISSYIGLGATGETILVTNDSNGGMNSDFQHEVT